MTRVIEALKLIAAACALIYVIGSVGAVACGTVGIIRGVVQTVVGIAVFGALLDGGGK